MLLNAAPVDYQRNLALYGASLMAVPPTEVITPPNARSTNRTQCVRKPVNRRSMKKDMVPGHRPILSPQSGIRPRRKRQVPFIRRHCPISQAPSVCRHIQTMPARIILISRHAMSSACISPMRNHRK